MKSMLKSVITLFSRNCTGKSQLENASDTGVFAPGHINEDSESAHQSSLPCNLKRNQAGILYADIAGYNRPTEKDEEGTHRRMVEFMRIMKALIAENNGAVAHFAGDAILARFKDADNALHCAIDIQLAARQRKSGIDPDRQLLLRIGVSFGTVIADQGDIYDQAVNLASRFEGLANSEGIYVSDAVTQVLDDYPSFGFVALAKRRVKKISGPAHAFSIEIDTRHKLDTSLTGAVKISAVAS